MHDIALSYSSRPNHEAYVASVAGLLVDRGYDVFYDKTGRHEFIAHNLIDKLKEIFQQAKAAVLFLSEAYQDSRYCEVERQAAQASLARRPILVMFDDARVDGVLETDYKLDARACEPRQLAEMIAAELARRGISPSSAGAPLDSEETYGLVFGIRGYRVAYIPPSSGSMEAHYNEIEADNLELICDRSPFASRQRPDSWEPSKDAANLARCRLKRCASTPEGLRITFQETCYYDYLWSEALLNAMATPGENRTYREVFLSNLRRAAGPNGYVVPFDELTNICGVGLWIVTQDNRIVVATHSKDSHVYPGRMTFSASGTMPWGAWPHPYTAVIQKAHQEIQHLVNPEKLKLFAFGLDARKLYFQFSFVEDSSQFTFEQLRQHFEKWVKLSTNPPRTIAALDFDPIEICKSLVDHCWEPAAEATLLTLLSKRFAESSIVEELSRYRHRWWKRAMRDEWDYRASRPAPLPDMSVRYEPNRLEEESKKYVDRVMAFLGEDVQGKDILEVGSGTGRLSDRLLERARSLTCVELSDAMIEQHKIRLGARAARVRYVRGFAQEVSLTHHEVAVCSLVLIHNVGEREFSDLVRVLCKFASVVFVFEDVSIRATSPVTKLRTETELRDAFAQHGFVASNADKYSLFSDELVFLRLSRTRA